MVSLYELSKQKYGTTKGKAFSEGSKITNMEVVGIHIQKENHKPCRLHIIYPFIHGIFTL